MQPPADKRGWVDLDGVTFSYPGAESPVLSDVSLERAARPDGGGDRLDRRRQDHAGQPGAPALRRHRRRRVSVAGTDVRELDPHALWSDIGLVPQRAYLFTGTVRSNLLHGRPEATDDELWEALAVAQARDFVAELPEGLDAPVAQGGTNFSGGQRQRLAIARAVVRRPGIYLFDDAFSALDLATDARLRAALRPITRDASVLVVAQRVSTIIDADLIVVLEDGRVVGRGTHEELLLTCGDLPGDRRRPSCPRRRWHERTPDDPGGARPSRPASRRPSGSRARAPARAAARWAAAWSARRRWTSARPPSACWPGCDPTVARRCSWCCSASSASR